jgi:hypothetical protein
MSETAALSVSSPTAQADAKISRDLIVLKEKMNLLDSMIHPSDSSSPKLSVKTNEALRSVIGYLDACGPRMIELVTACTTRENALSEDVFGDVLGCNDRLQKLLSDVDTRLLTETEASTTVAAAGGQAAAAASASSDLTDQFGDLLLGNEDPFETAHGSGEARASKTPRAGAKTTGEDDENENDGLGDLFSPSQAPSAAPAAAPPVPPPDPFDDFFAERTNDTKF